MQGWPALLPPPPALAFRVTPAGLLEWCGGEQAPADADLRVGEAIVFGFEPRLAACFPAGAGRG